MKILQLNCVCKRGSTGKITYGIHRGLKERGFESVICYGRGEKLSEQSVYKVCGELYSKFNNLLSRFTGIMYGGCGISTRRLLRIIKREKPDIVHLQCINGYFVNIYRLLNWLKKRGIKTVLTLHAEFMYTGNCGHALDCDKWKTGCGSCPRYKKETKSLVFDATARANRKMTQALRDFDELYVVAISDWVRRRAEQSPALKGKRIYTVNNGIDTQAVFKPVTDKDELAAVRKKYGIPENKKIILHVTPSTADLVKGYGSFLSAARKTGGDYAAVVLGAEKASRSEKLTEIKFVEDQQELAAIYSMAGALVITSVCDTYPTVSLEAQCCATPVAAFDVGGVKETISPGMGQTVPAGDIAALVSAMEMLCEMKDKIPEETVSECRKHHSSERMVNDYISLYKSILER